jgi:hypothetical protein
MLPEQLASRNLQLQGSPHRRNRPMRGFHEPEKGSRMKITEEPNIRLRTVTRPSTWRRLSLLEKIAVVQVFIGLISLTFLVVLVGSSMRLWG